MSETGDKPPFIKALAWTLISAANAKGRARELPETLKTAHTFNTEDKRHGITGGMDDGMADIFKDVLNHLDPIYRGTQGYGYVDFNSGGRGGSGPRIQDLMEEVGKILRTNFHYNLRDVKAKRIMRQIAEEIMQRNGW